ncbi:SEC14-like protein 2 [Hondaea fermentalgiana]|uniref:SEC14-like protein 2 n=1 Tax=Hondaea fermentalgiana TaxID=2315210 RepID=A0A2R5GKC2_9STRA|nr:SEC14-like protein 2 [Hondaea fermentalgiana]|eukprot:GBG28314.1 SEC14-like protein 2 [Hondaea fermentalgiana]
MALLDTTGSVEQHVGARKDDDDDGNDEERDKLKSREDVVIREAEERIADLEHEMLEAVRELRLRAGGRYERAMNRALLALCGLILSLELVVNQIQNDTHRMVSGSLVCAAMLGYVIAGSWTEDGSIDKEGGGGEEEAFMARVRAAGQRRRTLKAELGKTGAPWTRAPQMRSIREEESIGEESETTGSVQMPSTVDGWVIKSEAELASVEELRERLADLEDECTSRPLDLSDCVLIRFVRARKSLDESEAMFRAAAQWRRETRPELLLTDYAPSRAFRRWVPGGFCYSDREGTPLFIDRIGRLDVPTCMKHMRDEEYLDFAAVKEEIIEQKCIESQRRIGRPQYQVVVISDVKMLSMRHWHTRGIRVLKAAVSIDDTYYPERLKVAYIINAPKIFSFIWKVVKTFLDVNTRAKIQIFSNTPTEELLRCIPPEHLPKCYGGDLVVDGDPECKSILGIGGIIPDDYDASEDHEIGEGHFLRSAALPTTLAAQ